jgi:hypothetical protein
LTSPCPVRTNGAREAICFRSELVMSSVRHARRRHQLLAAGGLVLFGLSASAWLSPALAGGGCGARDLTYGTASCAVPYVDTMDQGTPAPAVSVFSTSIDRTLQNWGVTDAAAAADDSVASVGAGNVALDRPRDGDTERSDSRPAPIGSAGVSLSSLAASIRETIFRLLGKQAMNRPKLSTAPVRQLDPVAAVTTTTRNSIVTEERSSAGTTINVSTPVAAVSSAAEPAEIGIAASSEGASAVDGATGVANMGSGSSPIDLGPAVPGVPAGADQAKIANSDAIDLDVLGSGAERERQHSRAPRRRAAKKTAVAPRSKSTVETIDLQLAD